MNPIKKIILILAVLHLLSAASEVIVFNEEFNNVLSEGWIWQREDPEAWRLADGGLEIRIGPGNMWGKANDARNILYRPLPRSEKGSLTILATVENKPTFQYEQVDLVCYFDDANMVKIGLELVDAQLSVVMGREENDHTTTINIIPIESTKVQLKFSITGGLIRAAFRATDTENWRNAGKCELPSKTNPNISIQAYQGSAEEVHWARVTDFKIVKTE